MKIWVLAVLLLVFTACVKFEERTITIQDTIEQEHVLGNLSAPIEIIEYSDFQCPFSQKFYNEILPSLKQEYIDTGKARLVFRHLPLNSIHPYAHKAAEATECAAMQGKFWEMHKMLFEKGVNGGVEQFKAYAANLSINSEKFASCLDSNLTRQKVIANFYQGVNSGVKGTPAIIVNGRLIPEIRSYDQLKEYLALELNS